MNKINLKRGDTLELTIQYTDDDDLPVDLTDYDIKCQGRISDALIFDKSLSSGIIITNASEGKYTIIIDNTSNFPIDIIKSDIQYNNNGNIKSTNTFYIIIEEDITR